MNEEFQTLKKSSGDGTIYVEPIALQKQKVEKVRKFDVVVDGKIFVVRFSVFSSQSASVF